MLKNKIIICTVKFGESFRLTSRWVQRPDIITFLCSVRWIIQVVWHEYRGEVFIFFSYILDHYINHLFKMLCLISSHSGFLLAHLFVGSTCVLQREKMSTKSKTSPNLQVQKFSLAFSAISAYCKIHIASLFPYVIVLSLCLIRPLDCQSHHHCLSDTPYRDRICSYLDYRMKSRSCSIITN